MVEQATLRVGLLQSQLSWDDPAENRSYLEAFLTRASPRADIVVMPETFTTGFLGDSAGSGEGMDGPTVAWMKELAGRYRCVVTGSSVIDTHTGRANRLLWVEPDGRVSFYDKRHLFSYAGEDRRYIAGKERVIIEYRGWRICPQICYDLRFPVWCRNRADYDVLLVVANWPAVRVEAWSSLLKARAIENQCYVVAVNRVGEDGRGNPYTGQSVVHGPLGETLLALGGKEQYSDMEIDLSVLRSVRSELPFHADADPFTLSDG
jgi:predicted amidohydrolase